LSVCFLFHGSAHWFRVDPDSTNTWALTGLIAVYTLMMALAGFGIVRFGRVWDDARSIFAVVIMLFVALALALDNTMLDHVPMAEALALAGFCFAALVVEGLLHGLRIRLPVLFRVPLHGLLALLFVYPVLLVPNQITKDPELIAWRILLFSPCAAVAFLAFLPAVRRGARYVRDNGTPWSWPWFPWGIIGLLAACVGYRAFSLSLTFDPVATLNYQQAMELQSAFGGYFLVPMLLAAAIVMLEIGLVEQIPKIQYAALMIPVACFAIAFPSLARSGPHAEFLLLFVNQLGSPVLLSGIAGCLFYGYAWLRKVRFAEEALVTALLVTSFVWVDTLSLRTLSDPHPLPFVLIAIIQFGICIARMDSRRVVLGAVCTVMALRCNPWLLWPAGYRDFATTQLIVGSVLLVGIFFKDEFARLLRFLGAIALMIGGASTLTMSAIPPISTASWSDEAYLTLLVMISFAIAVKLKSRSFLFSGLFNSIIAAFEIVSSLLRRWPGIESFLIAVALFFVALAISIAKAYRNARSPLKGP